MDKKGRRRKKQGKRKINRENEDSRSISRIAFWSGFAWEFVTWICIPFCFLFMGIFLTTHNSRGAWWSGIALGIAIVIMIGLFGDRHWFRKEDGERVVPEKSLRDTENRPWLRVVAAPSGPISFAEGGRNGVTIPVDIQVTNTGRSPANDVRIIHELFFPQFGSNPVEKQKQIVASDSGMPFASGVIFPGDQPTHYRMGFLASLNDMLTHDTEEMKQHGAAGLYTEPYIGGCLRYKYGPAGSERTGETGFLFRISVRPVDNPKITLLVKIGQDVPEDRVVIEEPLIGGGGYAK